MYITSLQYIILVCLCYPVLHEPSEQSMTTLIGKRGEFANTKLEENETQFRRKLLKQDRKDYSVQAKYVPTPEYTSTEFVFVFLYHLISRKSTESILAATALFFWKASAFPVNITASKTRSAWETGVRSSSVSKGDVPSRGDCEADWFEFEENCYKAFEKRMNYKTAKEHCKSLGSELTNIRAANENALLKKLGNSKYLWTAVQKICVNCTQTEAGYVNWSPGQPSGVSSCIAMNPRGHWRDFDCEYMFAFVCKKAVIKDYTDRQLLIALLLPIFSCLTVATSFTLVLLVISVRGGGQPFKVASRYGLPKKERKAATWDMLDMLRRASLNRRGSKLKPHRAETPSIEITKVEDTNGTFGNCGGKKIPWYKRNRTSKMRSIVAKNKNLRVPEERRRSSNSSSSNSSLYELLARLNKMEFESPDETVVSKNDENDGMEMKDFGQQANRLTSSQAEEESCLSDSHRQLVEKERKRDENLHKDASFRNMAFRYSVPSVETNGGGITRVTSVQQMYQTDFLRKIEDISSCMGHDSHGSLHVCSCDKVREETDSSSTQTVRADIHISKKATVSTRNSNIEKHSEENLQSSKGKVIWMYSL